jgi:hypothetical protein
MREELNKVYLTTDDLENYFSIKKSRQAQLRMKKKIPYVRPAGGKVCLYERAAIEKWLEEWEVA